MSFSSIFRISINDIIVFTKIKLSATDKNDLTENNFTRFTLAPIFFDTLKSFDYELRNNEALLDLYAAGVHITLHFLIQNRIILSLIKI